MHGYIDDFIAPPYYVGVNLTFGCERGLDLIGASLRQCLPNGRWSGVDTVCTELRKYLNYFYNLS